jgi:hypothetical protein
VSTALLALTLYAFVAAPLGADGPAVHFLDDRGQSVDSPLEACFQLALKPDCREIGPRETVTLPQGFFTLRVEGPEHGPVSVPREDLLLSKDGGTLRVTVPRKALLSVDRRPAEPLTVSLYDPQDPAFRTPRFRARLSGPEIKIPSGLFVASLSSGRRAPDLQRLSAPPGGRVRLTNHPRDGWSLVLRCRSATTGREVAGAAVAVSEVTGYGRADRPLAEGLTGKDGIVLFSGLGAAMAGASVHPAKLVGQEVRGLTATPGTFAVRDVELESGGRVRAQITVKGRPVAGADCEVLDRESNPAGRPKDPRKLFAGRSDRQGLCRSGLLAAGAYTFRVTMPVSRATVERPLQVDNDAESDLELALTPIHVAGRVQRGGKPAPGFTVRILDFGSHGPAGEMTEAATAQAGEEGAWEATIWTPGEYLLGLRSPAGTPSATRKIVTLESPEETVDFDLPGAGFNGRVVDPQGRPVEQAKAILKWNGGMLIATTGQDGSFEIPTGEEGSGTIFAQKKGFRGTDPVAVTASPEGATPPVVLVLTPSDSLQGKVVSSAGGPVPDAMVSVSSMQYGGNTIPILSTRTDSTGSFEIERFAGARLRAFVSGPGCPLSSFDVAGEQADLVLRCPELPAALNLTFKDAEGRAVPHAAILMRQRGEVIPQTVLSAHLALLGLPAESDGGGHLALIGLAPGDYDLFLASASSEDTASKGLPSGFLTSASLPALSTVEMEVVAPP